MNIQDELRSLQELHDAGGISDADFEQSKARLLNVPPTGAVQAAYGNTDQQTRQWAMFLHFSQFAGYVIPLAGLIAPILIWQMKKNEMPEIDAHGKVVLNWMLSAVIYAVASIVLIFVLIGIPLLLALAAVAIIFPIVGGIKANNGELWKYPLSIPFFK